MKELLNRKLVFMVVGPIARTALTVITGYLTGKGVPPEIVGQFGEAIAVGAAIGFNIAWDLVSKMKAESKGARSVLADLNSNIVGFGTMAMPFHYDEVRARFDREGG